jgi:hypothetical protein
MSLGGAEHDDRIMVRIERANVFSFDAFHRIIAHHPEL